MDIVLRATAAYFFILLLMRVVGRRELSTLEPFDLIMQGVTQNDFSVVGLLIAGGTIAVLQMAVSWFGFRSPTKVGVVIEGEPMVLVEGGRWIEKNLRRERLTEDEVLSDARRDSISQLDQIEWAILETGGEITFIKKKS